MGHELAGIITEIGSDVKNIKVGDRVTSETTYETCMKCASCATKDYNLCSNRKGIGTQVNGSMAEYVVSREESIHVIPANVSLLSASLTEPLACGVHSSIEKAKVKSGDIVCVFGPGTIGQMVSQVCKSQGATVIIAGISHDKERLSLAKANGADFAVDQDNEDLDACLKARSKDSADIAFECSGSVAALNKALQIVRRKGRVIQMGVFANAKESIYTDMILHRELEYIGSRSQKPSSWRIAVELMGKGTIVPERIVTSIVSLENWREGFDSLKRGEGVKAVIRCNPDIADA
jgi:L-iditol 2-dehydrogenase